MNQKYATNKTRIFLNNAWHKIILIYFQTSWSLYQMINVINTYSKVHFIKKYMLSFADGVCFVILHQLI